MAKKQKEDVDAVSSTYTNFLTDHMNDEFDEIPIINPIMMELVNTPEKISPHDFFQILDHGNINISSEERTILCHNFKTKQLTPKQKDLLIKIQLPNDYLHELYGKLLKHQNMPAASQEYRNMVKKMKQERESRGITQQEVAYKCNLTKNYISSLERGLNKCSAETLILYAKAINVPVSVLVGDMADQEIDPELQSLIASLDSKTQKKILNVIKAMLS